MTRHALPKMNKEQVYLASFWYRSYEKLYEVNYFVDIKMYRTHGDVPFFCNIGV